MLPLLMEQWQRMGMAEQAVHGGQKSSQVSKDLMKDFLNKTPKRGRDEWSASPSPTRRHRGCPRGMRRTTMSSWRTWGTQRGGLRSHMQATFEAYDDRGG
jgi:hypothetical protein